MQSFASLLRPPATITPNTNHHQHAPQHKLTLFTNNVAASTPRSPRLIAAVHGFPDGHAAPRFGVDGQSGDGDQGRDFLVAGEGGGDGEAARVELRLADGAAVEFAIGTAATAGEAFGAWFAANFAVQAAKSNLAGTSAAVHAGVHTDVEAASSAAEDDFVLIDGVSVSAAHD